VNPHAPPHDAIWRSQAHPPVSLFTQVPRRGILGRRAEEEEEEFAHAGEKAEVSINTVKNAEPVIERVRGQL
jgi:hypothetical protein